MNLSIIVQFTVMCLVAFNRSEAKGELIMIQTLLFFKCKFHMLSCSLRYWSLSQQGQLQPHSKSKAWQLSTQL